MLKQISRYNIPVEISREQYRLICVSLLRGKQMHPQTGAPTPWGTCLPRSLMAEKWECLHKLTVYIMQITDNVSKSVWSFYLMPATPATPAAPASYIKGTATDNLPWKNRLAKVCRISAELTKIACRICKLRMKNFQFFCRRILTTLVMLL